MHFARTCIGLLSVGVIALAFFSCSSPKTDPVAPGATPEATPALDRVTMEQEPAPLRVGRVFALPTFPSIDGVQTDAASLLRGKSVVVLAMTSSGCPVSQKYGPRVAAMEREFAARGVAFVHVNTVAAESDAEIREQIKEAGFRGTYAPDRDRALARVLSPRTTSEAYVFDSTWTLRYRGAIDDQFGVGVALQSPRRHFLRDAIEAVLKKGTPTVAATWAPGCLVDAPDAARDALAAGASPVKPNPPPRGITYYNRVAHILDRHCLDCHRTNGPGPFNLASASSIEGRAAMIAAVVRDGLMPPSHGEEQSHGVDHWRAPIEMPAQDRADLIAWLSSDRPLGSPSDAPKPNPRPLAWTLGTPDQVLMTPTMRLPAEGALAHERLVLPTATPEDVWITAIDVRPMKQGTIQHAVAWSIPPGTPAPSAEDDLSRVAGMELLAAYSPGHGFVQYRDGAARRFRAGSTVIVDVYARPMGKRMGVSLRIGLHTLAQGAIPTREIRSMVMYATPFTISAGDGAFEREVRREVGEGASVVAITPGMGPRGRSARLVAEGAGELLRVSNYDSRWQIRYEPVGGVRLAPRTTLTLRGELDNSANNPANPTPEAIATSGPGASQESLWVGVEYVAESANK